MMIKAVLDACVLYPAPLRDLLLSLADAKLIQPYWSEEIQNEWTRNLLRNRPDLKRESLDRTCRRMDLHFPDGLVHGYESIIPTLTLIDSKDRHVLAVAIHVKAMNIVTFNLKDFPQSALLPYQIIAVSPDELTMRVIEYDAKETLAAVAKHRANLSRPPKTADEYLATLVKQGVPKTVAFLREHIDEI